MKTNAIRIASYGGSNDDQNTSVRFVTCIHLATCHLFGASAKHNASHDHCSETALGQESGTFALIFQNSVLQ